MLCVEGKCGRDAKGYDIEKAFDEESEPVYVIYFRCAGGHEFIAEYDRKVGDEDREVAFA